MTFVHRLLPLALAVTLFTSHGTALAQVPPDNDDQAARRAAIAAARGQLEQAQARVRAAEQRVRADAKANPDMAAAEAELDAAQAELDRASEPVLAKLKDDQAYQAVLQEEIEAARTLGKEQRKAVAADPASTQPTTASADNDVTVAQEESALNVPVPTDGQLVAAVDKIEQRSKRRDMEADAIAADATANAAQARVDTANATLKALRAQFEATLLNDPEYKAAREQLAAARAEVTRAAGANY